MDMAVNVHPDVVVLDELEDGGTSSVTIQDPQVENAISWTMGYKDCFGVCERFKSCELN